MRQQINASKRRGNGAAFYLLQLLMLILVLQSEARIANTKHLKKPRISSNSTGPTYEGDSFQLICEFDIATDHILEFMWYPPAGANGGRKNLSMHVDGERHNIGRYVLTVTNATKSDSGKYTCSVMDRSQSMDRASTDYLMTIIPLTELNAVTPPSLIASTIDVESSSSSLIDAETSSMENRMQKLEENQAEIKTMIGKVLSNQYEMLERLKQATEKQANVKEEEDVLKVKGKLFQTPKDIQLLEAHKLQQNLDRLTEKAIIISHNYDPETTTSDYDW